MSNKKFVNITIVSIIIVIVGIVSYFTLSKSVPSPVVDSAESGVMTNESLKHNGPLLLEAWFEGYDRLYYEFNYPEFDFSVTASSDNKKIILKEIATGKTSVINISYEGGRGYTPQDYWIETLKPTCPNCSLIDNSINIKDAQGLITFANQDKEWIIFSGPADKGGSAWLFVAELQKPALSVEKVLSSFVFKSATSGDMVSGGISKDEMGNWKTYRNQQYGFEVKYPESYSEFNKSGDTLISLRSNNGCKELSLNGGVWPVGCRDYSISVQKNKLTSQGVGLIQSQVAIGGIQAEVITNSDGMWENMTQSVVQFKKGQDWYVQTFTYSSQDQEASKKLMDQILSSFKFMK